MSVPSLTRSPAFSFTSRTVPAAGEGTSMVALSDSSVTSDWSSGDGVARLDQHVDHADVLQVTDDRNPDLEGGHDQTVQGSGEVGLMPYFARASAARVAGIGAVARQRR